MRRFDFTKQEVEYIKESIYLTEIQQRVFEYRLKGYSLTKMAQLEHCSESTISRELRVVTRKISKRRSVFMSNKTYDFLKLFALTLPLITTFIIAVMKIWNIPYATEIALTLTAFNTLIAEIVKLANKNYQKIKGEK